MSIFRQITINGFEFKSTDDFIRFCTVHTNRGLISLKSYQYNISMDDSAKYISGLLGKNKYFNDFRKIENGDESFIEYFKHKGMNPYDFLEALNNQSLVDKEVYTENEIMLSIVGIRRLHRKTTTAF